MTITKLPKLPLDRGDFSFERAMKNLKIRQLPFDHEIGCAAEGDTGGTAKAYSGGPPDGRNLSIRGGEDNSPERTVLHEMAHIVLGHTDPSRAKLHAIGAMLKPGFEQYVRAVHEIEAESVAALLTRDLGIDKSPDESIKYMAGWAENFGPRAFQAMPATSNRSIIRAAKTILLAGKTKV